MSGQWVCMCGQGYPCDHDPPKRKYTRFEEGLMVAAHHLDYTGEDKLRDEVLRLQGLTVADLRRVYVMSSGAAHHREGTPHG